MKAEKLKHGPYGSTRRWRACSPSGS